MRQFFAIVGDSFRESVDRRALIVLVLLSMFPILFCFGVSFPMLSESELLQQHVEQIPTFHRIVMRSSTTETTGVTAKLLGARAVSEGDAVPSGFADAHLVDFKFESIGKVDHLVTRWEKFRKRAPGKRDEIEEEAAPAPDPEARVRFLKERFGAQGWNQVHVATLVQDPPSYRVVVKAEDLKEVSGAHRMRYFFGIWDRPMTRGSVAETVVEMQQTMGGVVLGGFGMLVAILCCAAFIPNMLQKGSLDLVLARPIGRTRLLLCKYFGGLWFMFLVACFMIVGCWVGLALRTGYSSPWFLGTIFVATLSFAILYSTVTLIGVLTKSGTVAGLLGIGVWWASSTIVATRHQFEIAARIDEVPGWLHRWANILYTILPKTSDLGHLNAWILSRSQLSEKAFNRLFASRLPEIDWFFSLGTTVLFAAVMLGMALWCFRRRDY